MNERITENIIRDHFKNDDGYDRVHVEEQKSKIPTINKLLKHASKSGRGPGRPEFLITFKSNPNFVIVIECKADATKHESVNQDKYSEYAVDGVLHYASHLSKGVDVLAIAVSGETEQTLNVSHFLQLKNETEAVPFLGIELLPLSNYHLNYIKSPEKFREDHTVLLKFAKQLNMELHGHKILESQRSLLISCILIALENPSFKGGYALHKTPGELATALVNAVSSELISSNISKEKVDNLEIQFSFIKTDTSLSKKDNVLKEIIDAIDENVNGFIKTHEYTDVLGELYVEFLSHANSDKGLGIVLTPIHITEFFADLAQVNKNSVIYDNCTGTAGFLIGAMKRMINDADGNLDKIRNIKSNQLIGTEFQSHIFALAVSNMFIHQDGKSNILNGSCFDKDIITEVKSKKPTIGFLNPPYKADKKNDVDELDFVLNNLDCLATGGTCIAIVPMQRALADKGKVMELKKRLLEKHTLEAVLSMPKELFINSDVNVVTCIMVFTAHKPHPNNKETYFGYYNDDGFVKRKGKGRSDIYNKWNDIMDKWLSNFINRKNEPGLSVNKVVTPKMEWCAEAYIKTDYSKSSEMDFEDVVLDYAVYRLKERQSNYVSNEKTINNVLNLNISKWKPFRYDQLFNIKKGTTIIDEFTQAGDTPYIRSISSNNGVIGFFDLDPNHSGNIITVNSNGSVGEAFYQSMPFCASGDVNVLYPTFELNPFIAMFLITMIEKDKFKFNFGRKWGVKRMNVSTIQLPANENGNPDWEFMENYIKSLPYSSSLK